jgi:hypothetical protein
MRRVLSLLLLTGLLLAFGCGQDGTVIEPNSVPPRPQGPPSGAVSSGGQNQDQHKSAAPVIP